jgi:hypothetical protein
VRARALPKEFSTASSIYPQQPRPCVVHALTQQYCTVLLLWQSKNTQDIASTQCTRSSIHSNAPGLTRRNTSDRPVGQPPCASTAFQASRRLPTLVPRSASTVPSSYDIARSPAPPVQTLACTVSWARLQPIVPLHWYLNSLCWFMQRAHT